MAEQEACTELVKQASQEQSGRTIDGESLLLPLLQGLLDAPENEQLHDSGTESGEDQRTGLIAEVQNALDKLSASLKNDATDITAERRSSLLYLVTKLQAGLASAASDKKNAAKNNEPPTRFSRRRERPERHTIGVTSEELADARRLMEEISCSSSRSSMVPKQGSSDNVNHSYSYTSLAVSSNNPRGVVKNSTPKPFSCSNSASTTSSSVQTPSEDCINYLFEELNNKEDNDASSSMFGQENIDGQEHHPDLFKAKCVNTINNVDSEEDEDSSTIRTMDNNYPKPDLIMQSNPLYNHPMENDSANKFVTKKLRMRRANTIDIPKPLHFHEDEEDSEYEEGELRNRRSNYLALRGPIRVGNNYNPNRNSMPILEPKTESDKKFLAFINRQHNKNQSNVLWAKDVENKLNWKNNKFDHLKTNFERPENAVNSARNFWKSTDDASMSFKTNRYDPKISKRSAMNLKKMFEEKQRQNEENVVKASMKLSSTIPEKTFNKSMAPQPLPMNKFSHAASSAFQPIHRQFEQPNQGKFASKSLDASKTSWDESANPKTTFLYSPKPLHKEETASTSPFSAKPWLSNAGESRVLSIAAKKFENPSTPPTNSFQPRRLSKEKISIPKFQNNPSEKLTAPYLLRSMEQKSNTVRKLSGQYNELGSHKNQIHPTDNSSKNVEGFQARFTIPQNYSIRYDKPRIDILQQQQHHVTTTPSDIKKYNHQVNHTFTEKPQHKPSDIGRNVPKEFKRLDLPQETGSRIPSVSPNYEAQTRVKTEVYRPYPEPNVEVAAQPRLSSQISLENLEEYSAINSRVMEGPIAQQASTVRQKSPMTRNEHDMEAAFALRNTLQKVNSSNSPSPDPRRTGQSDKTSAMETKNLVNYISENSKNVKSFPRLSESHAINTKGEHIVTGKLPIPSITLRTPDVALVHKPTFGQVLSKSDSWHRICMTNQEQPQHKPSARSSPNARTVMKSKSTHSIMIPPKQFEAGMTKDEIEEKKKTLEAFFGGPAPTVRGSPKIVKRAINRTKTSEKNAQYKDRQMFGVATNDYNNSGPILGLARSKTLPDIVCPDMLDENNIDKAFEDLFTSS